LNHTHINSPTPTTFQVRIVKDGKERSRAFAFRHWGGREKALKAAISWRDQMYVLMNKNLKRRVTSPLKNNKSTGVVGISRTIQTDYRKSLSYLIFQVNWTDETGKKHTKGFRVGNIETYDKKLEEKAFKAAKAFRKDYEHCVDTGTVAKFDLLDYFNWRESD